MPTVSRDDLQRVLGELDDPKLIDILALDPSLGDLEEAVVVATGDHDLLAKRGHGVSPTAVRIAEILSADEDEKDSPAGPGR
jgi:hypothetical protein